jgi:hypothetical protein
LATMAASATVAICAIFMSQFLNGC